MHFFRHHATLRLVGATLLVSFAPALVAPVFAADRSHASPYFAEWLERRVDRELPAALRALLDEAAGAPSTGLDDFVRHVVATAVREEGLAFTSMALSGRFLPSEADLAAFLLSGVRSLGASAIPPGTLTGTVDAPTALAPRIDRGLPVPDVRAPGVPVRTGVRTAATPAVFAPLDPGRGSLQPQGP